MKFAHFKHIDMSKIMKRRVANTLVSLETMKELEFMIIFFLRDLAGLHESLSAI